MEIEVETRDGVAGLLTTPEVASHFRVTNATVQRWCREGRFPGAWLGVRHGRVTWLVPQQDVESFKRPRPGRRA